MDEIITGWTDSHTERFQKAIFTFQHKLNETGLFTDEALIDLLDRHPHSRLDVCTMSVSEDPRYPNRFRTGDFRDASGKLLLEAAKAGCIWINLRKAMNIHPEYKAVLDNMYGDLSEKTGLKTFTANGGILISSPIAKVPYHFDKTETILWHVRGKKRIYVYPQTEEFISDEAYESALTDYLDDDLPYKTEFEDYAKVIDLKGNESVTWPLNSPHRVDNRTFCVSVTTEYSTPQSVQKNSAMLTNAALRHHFGMSPSYRADNLAKRQIKSVFGRVLKKTGVVPNTSTADMVTFKLDPNIDGFLVDTTPYKRDF